MCTINCNLQNDASKFGLERVVDIEIMQEIIVVGEQISMPESMQHIFIKVFNSRAHVTCFRLSFLSSDEVCECEGSVDRGAY